MEYQPKIVLTSNTVRGVEALIRWRRGMIFPAPFIPLAEKGEAINHICRWVITRTTKDNQLSREQGLIIPTAINDN